MELNKWSQLKKINSGRWMVEDAVKYKIWEAEDIKLTHGNVFFLSADDDMSGGMLSLFSIAFI